MKTQLFAVDFESFTGEENIGIARLTAFLKQEKEEVVSTYCYLNRDINQEMEKVDFSCDMFGFSAYPDNIQYIIEMSQRIKEKNSSAIIFLGSMYATLYAETLLADCSEFDFVILGHGEYPMLHAIRGISSGQGVDEIAETSIHIVTRSSSSVPKKVCSTDINTLPLPDRSYLENGDYISAYICNAQGCTATCSFCVQRKNVRWSGRPAQSLLDEILDVHRRTAVRIFKFTSGSFEDPGVRGKRAIKELCLLLKEQPIQFSFKCYLRAESFKNVPEDIELLQLMKDVGFSNVLIGIETGNEDDLKIYSKRATLDDLHNSLDIMASVGIYAQQFGFIMINPYSTPAKLQQNYEFLVKFNSPFVLKYISNLFVSYNTQIYHMLQQDGMLKEEYSYKNQTAYHFVDKQVQEAAEFIRQYFYQPEDIEKHERFYGIVELFHQAEPLVDSSDLQGSFYESLNEIFLLCRDYFARLYVENDLELCIALYPQFIEQVSLHYEKCNAIKNKMLRRLMKNKIKEKKAIKL